MTDSDKTKSRFRSSKCNINGRVYVIDLLQYANGCLSSVCEDPNPRIGAITVSIKSGERATSSALIPESKGSIFAAMVGELLAEKTRGIAVISLYLREELDASSMKTLINEVSSLLSKD